MAGTKVALVQLRSRKSPDDNVGPVEAAIREAAAQGASYVQTPEMTNMIDRTARSVVEATRPEDEDEFLRHFRGVARELGITLHLGSLAIRVPAGVANRGFVIAPDGAIAARYDKIHMFDVDLPNGESWRESRLYRPGDSAVVVDAAGLRVGMSVCYDLRFPALYRSLAIGGANVLAIPAAFTRTTGEAHWHVLMRARAIETGSYVLAAAQGGTHEDGRETFGHSLVIDPWGRIVAEAAHDEPAVVIAEIDPAQSTDARTRIPVLRNERHFSPPEALAEAAQ